MGQVTFKNASDQGGSDSESAALDAIDKHAYDMDGTPFGKGEDSHTSHKPDKKLYKDSGKVAPLVAALNEQASKSE